MLVPSFNCTVRVKRRRIGSVDTHPKGAKCRRPPAHRVFTRCHQCGFSNPSTMSFGSIKRKQQQQPVVIVPAAKGNPMRNKLLAQLSSSKALTASLLSSTARPIAPAVQAPPKTLQVAATPQIHVPPPTSKQPETKSLPPPKPSQQQKQQKPQQQQQAKKGGQKAPSALGSLLSTFANL